MNISFRQGRFSSSSRSLSGVRPSLTPRGALVPLLRLAPPALAEASARGRLMPLVATAGAQLPEAAAVMELGTAATALPPAATAAAAAAAARCVPLVAMAVNLQATVVPIGASLAETQGGTLHTWARRVG